jgi:TolA-binding protein
MNRVDLHPEDLLDRTRRGIASAQEVQRLHAHLESCPACRYEYTLARDCAEGAAELPGDEALLVRVRAGAARALRTSALSRQGGRLRRRPSRVLLLAAAAVVLLATLTAGATFARRAWNRTFARYVEQSIGSSHSSGTTNRKPAQLPAGPSTAEDDLGKSTSDNAPEAQLPPPEADDSAKIAPTEEPSRTPPSRAAAPIDRAKTVEPAATAAELFARANLARRRGDMNEAAHTYRDLQSSFPGSPEEIVSRVTLGRLLLDRLGDARGALVQFDSYLANPTHGALREEALIGRALALGRLHRQAEEKGAWAALVAAYPKSAYAERARARLEELH